MHATTVANPPIKTAASPGWGLVWVLAGLLLAQIALALFLGLRGAGPSPAGREAPLLAFEPAKVERIRIERPGSDPVVLERADTGWQVQSLAGFPAAAARVDALLDRLAGLKRGLPVATSQEALARLKVADSDHEGRLSLEGGGKQLVALYLGDAAGVRRRYVRAGGEGSVHEAELSPADIPGKADDWADRALLSLDEGDMQRIELPGIRLEKAEGGWRLVGLKEGEALDQAKAADVARRLGSLSFVSVLGAEDKPEYRQDAPVLEWRVDLASGATPSYRLSRLKPEADQAAPANDGAAETSKPKGPEWYVLKASDRPYYLKVASYTAEGLLGTTREGLMVKPETGQAEGPAESPAPAGSDPVQASDAEGEPSPAPEDGARAPRAERAEGPQ
jgi:hypothetical protein